MKPIRNLVPYMASKDASVNASLTMLKLFKRIRLLNPNYKPSSRYQMRLANKQAARRTRLHIVRCA